MFAIEVATSPAIRYSGAYLLVHAYVRGNREVGTERGRGRWGGGGAEGQREAEAGGRRKEYSEKSEREHAVVRRQKGWADE